jgi:hypothetical protein
LPVWCTTDDVRAAVFEAVTEGLRRESAGNENEDIDLSLAEMNARKRISRAEYARLGISQGLSYGETMRLRVGLLLDLWEVYVKSAAVRL